MNITREIESHDSQFIEAWVQYPFLEKFLERKQRYGSSLSQSEISDQILHLKWIIQEQVRLRLIYHESFSISDITKALAMHVCEIITNAHDACYDVNTRKWRDTSVFMCARIRIRIYPDRRRFVVFARDLVSGISRRKYQYKRP